MKKLDHKKIKRHCNLRHNNIIHFMITGVYCSPSPRGDVVIENGKYTNLGINKDLKN